MDVLRLLLLAALLPGLFLPGSVIAGRKQYPADVGLATVILPGETLRISTPVITLATAPASAQVHITVTAINTGKRPFILRPGDFMLAAEGDIFGQIGAQPASLTGAVLPGTARSGRLTFLVPVAALPDAFFAYQAERRNVAARIPLSWLSMAVSRANATPLATITEYPLNGGVGDPWGTAIDASGDIWFAEPGCDFAPTCSSSAPPGQIGELLAGSHALRFYTLPDITGNQPIFLAIDRSGNIWFTMPNNSMIGEFNPSTQQFVGQWPVTPGSGPWDLTFNKGMIWYTEHFVSSIGEFNPNNHTHRDFPTPSPNSNPYGIAANDPVNGDLIWFTENNSSVARIAVLDIARNYQIDEFPIRAQLPSDLTPHLLALDYRGFPWWTEGWVRAIGELNTKLAIPGQCGTSSGDCRGVTEYYLPPPPASCSSSHVSGIAIQGKQLGWIDDSLSAQVGSFDPYSKQFTLYDLSNCNAHPHDGLNLDASFHVWWDEEFANALGELIQ
jgi:streptogramin lyase